MISRQTRLNPRKLLRTYTLVSIVSMAVIVACASFGISRVITARNIEEAVQDAVVITRSLYELERGALFEVDEQGERSLRIREKDFSNLDERMHFFLSPMNIVKIKVFSRNKVVIYSTDHAIIGRADPDNVKLARAIQGEIVSSLGKKDEIWDLAGEQRKNVDIVETYLPVRDDSEVVGSFEVYLDITRRQAQIKGTVFASTVVVLSVLIVVFGLLYVFMRRGTRELAQVQDDLEHISITDPLTGIYNRRHLFQRAGYELSRLKRQVESGKTSARVGVILIDIDHFKNINDKFGHLAGDIVISEVAARIRGVTREYDNFGRYGGEEFLLIFPNTNEAGLKSVAERIWRVIRSEPFAISADAIPVTCSLGASLMMEHDDDVEASIHRSDVALYHAKQTGRDKISYHGMQD